MIIKINDKVYGTENKMMIILSEEDKKNISGMTPENSKYCQFPEDVLIEEIQTWMEDVSSVIMKQNIITEIKNYLEDAPEDKVLELIKKLTEQEKVSNENL